MSAQNVPLKQWFRKNKTDWEYKLHTGFVYNSYIRRTVPTHKSLALIYVSDYSKNVEVRLKGAIVKVDSVDDGKTYVEAVFNLIGETK